MAAMVTDDDYVLVDAAASGTSPDDQAALGVAPLCYRLTRTEKFRLILIQARKKHIRQVESNYEEMATYSVSASAWSTVCLVLFLVAQSIIAGSKVAYIFFFVIAVICSVATWLFFYTGVYQSIGELKQMEVEMGDECRDFMRAVEESAAAPGAAVDEELRLQIGALQRQTVDSSGLKLMPSVSLALIYFIGIGFAGLFMYLDYLNPMMPRIHQVV